MSTLRKRFRLPGPVVAWTADHGRAVLELIRLLARLSRFAWRAAPDVLALLALIHLSLAVVPVVHVWVYKCSSPRIEPRSSSRTASQPSPWPTASLSWKPGRSSIRAGTLS